MLTSRENSSVKQLLTAITLSAVLLFVPMNRASADAYDCQRRTARADHKLHEAIEHHGYRSRQADHWRHELHEARERCWRERQQWWNEHEHRWHHDHVWDDRDHDRDQKADQVSPIIASGIPSQSKPKQPVSRGEA